jgi:retinol-binding protein 3
MKKKLIPLCLFLVWQHACLPECQAQSGPQGASLQITPAITRALIDSLGQVLYDHYIFPDTARKWAAYLEAQYKKGAYAGIKDPDDLANHLQQDLQKAHHDGHFRLLYAPDMARDLADTTHMAQRQRVGDSMQLINMRSRNFGFTKVEILPGNIGYVKFNGFVGFLNEARPTITGAFRFLANTQAIIIDLRDNGGGNPAMVSQIESYFFPVKTHMNDIINRKNGTEVFWTDPAKADSVLLQQPVYILTSRHTFSGAEDFSYGMQTIHRAVIVGDTTGGGAHPVGPVPVTLGFVANIPFARTLNPYTHTDWEGIGVIPDIPIPSANALEAAEKAIFTKWSQTAATGPEKAQGQWELDDLLARSSQETRNPDSLTPYIGTYQGGMVFYTDPSGFYCRNAARGNQLFKLIPVSGDKFILDENVHVEFTKDDKGNVTGIDLWWSDGRQSHKPKE